MSCASEMKSRAEHAVAGECRRLKNPTAVRAFGAGRLDRRIEAQFQAYVEQRAQVVLGLHAQTHALECGRLCANHVTERVS